MFFQVFAGGEQRYHPSRRAVVSRFCITEVRPRPYADLWQTRHRVNVDQTIKISSGSIGGTPEATSAIIHQRIFVTCKRHFSSVSGGSIPTRPLSPSLYPSLAPHSTAYVARHAPANSAHSSSIAGWIRRFKEASFRIVNFVRPSVRRQPRTQMNRDCDVALFCNIDWFMEVRRAAVSTADRPRKRNRTRRNWNCFLEILRWK